MKSSHFIKLVLPLLVVAGVATTYFMRSNSTVDEATSEVSAIKNKQLSNTSALPGKLLDYSKRADPNSLIDNVAERIEKISERSDLSQYDSAEINEAIDDPRVWDLNGTAAVDELPIDEDEKTDGRAFFKANPARVAITLPGDILEVSLPESDAPLQLEVEQVGAPGDGSVSLKGKITNLAGTFNMTQMNNVVAGHINTATNTYSFEMIGNTGWIHESGALFTGELPPVIGDDDQGGSTLGHAGEHVIANGNTNTLHPENETPEQE